MIIWGEVNIGKGAIWKATTVKGFNKEERKTILTWSPRPHSTLQDVHSAQSAQLPGTASGMMMMMVMVMIDDDDDDDGDTFDVFFDMEVRMVEIRWQE